MYVRKPFEPITFPLLLTTDKDSLNSHRNCERTSDSSSVVNVRYFGLSLWILKMSADQHLQRYVSALRSLHLFGRQICRSAAHSHAVPRAALATDRQTGRRHRFLKIFYLPHGKPVAITLLRHSVTV